MSWRLSRTVYGSVLSMPRQRAAQTCNAGVGIIALLFTAAAAGQPILYVNAAAPPGGNGASWATAHNNLQNALQVASGGGVTEIWVAAGVYKPTTEADRAATFGLLNGLALYGGFNGTETQRGQRNPNLHATILSGDIGINGDNSDNSYHVVSGGGTDATAVLDGFTIRNGNASLNNSVDDRGAGLYVNAGSPTVRVCRFESNQSLRFGGAVFIATGGAPVFDVCAFVGNVAPLRAGAVSNDGAAQFLNCLFENNQSLDPSEGLGGAVFNNTGAAVPVFEACIFLNNQANDAGAARNDVSNALFYACLFDANSAARTGGAVSNRAGSRPVFIACAFQYNTAASAEFTYGGGSVYCENSTLTMTDCAFQGNSAVSSGGAVLAHANTVLMLDNCTFENNTAGLGGGAIFQFVQASLGLVNCRLAGNSSLQGGAITTFGEELTLANCIFLNNTSSHSGALNANGSRNVIGRNVVFLNNTSSQGGAVGVTGTDTLHVTFTDCLFSGNAANQRGGGLYVLLGHLILQNCTLSDNAAGADGGGLFQAATGFSSITVKNCAFGGDDPNWAGGVGPQSVTYSCIGSPYPGTGNLVADPQFVDPNDPNGPDNMPGTSDDGLRLQPGSPCIDAGRNADVPAGMTTDLAGDPRFADMPCTPDTGDGTPPIVDMGAYEHPALPDTDGDGVCDAFDNCPNTPNTNQTDSDNDGVGDVCDNCPFAANPGQEDCDGDGMGDVCDSTDHIEITAQPQGRAAVAGHAALLSINAAGTPPISYQWRMDSVNISGATGNTLLLDPVLLADAGLYDVVMSNLCGSATSDGARLTVTALRADLNCDGTVDFFDFDPFILAVLDRAAYATQYPNCDAAIADINCDGVMDLFDIEPFIACLLNGGC